MKKSKKTEENSTYKYYAKVRGDWGNVKPVTRVQDDKKKEPTLEEEMEEYYDSLE